LGGEGDAADAFGAVFGDWVEGTLRGENGVLVEEHRGAPFSEGRLNLKTTGGRVDANDLKDHDPEEKKGGYNKDDDVHFWGWTSCAAITTGF
jgi:hypothetical protein